MVTTNDDSLAQKIRCLRDHGAAMSDLQRHLGKVHTYLLIILMQVLIKE